ncbi:hypothetical protein ABIA35_001586 [Catenulispora sp. MAP12-49]|uniref:FG-GAP repeat domain-containing protein n=1 Tax=Catenulispora sp. MAP12-49 TaxID=3156302 RepID=UPI003518B5D8
MRTHNGNHGGHARRLAMAGAAALAALSCAVLSGGAAAASVLPAPYGDLNADGNIDLMSVSSTGTLQTWEGNGTGGVGAPIDNPNQAQPDFSDALIDGAGNFNRGAYQSLPIYRSTNSWVYVEVGDGTGTFSSGHEVSVEPPNLATSWPAITQLVSPGDITGHNRADLVGRVGDQLEVFANTALYHYNTPVAVAGSGWSGRTVIGVIDVTGDGVKDLIARDDATGVIWLYPGVAGGTFGDESTRVQIGSGLDAADYPFVITKGDVTGDGHADIYAVGASGGLYLLSGNASGGFGAPALVSSDPAWTGIKALG